MRFFVLGATGSIGTGLVSELREQTHHVMALSRSEAADAKLRSLGAIPCRGDLRSPEDWADLAVSHDALIHTACTAFEDMPLVDARVTDALLAAAKSASHRPRVIYTGSCWFYGATGEQTAHEGPPFKVHPSFEWMIESSSRLLACPDISTAILVPGMVYHIDGGVFRRFIASARKAAPIEIWGSADTRWPLIHRDDLAKAYCALLERPQLTGYFNAATENSVRVGDIATGIAKALGSVHPHHILPVSDVVHKFGAWASGPVIDHSMGAARLRNEADWQPTICDWTHSDLMKHLTSEAP